MMRGIQDLGQLREDLKQRVTEITRALDGLRPVLDNNTRAVAELNNSITSLNANIGTLIKALQKQ